MNSTKSFLQVLAGIYPETASIEDYKLFVYSLKALGANLTYDKGDKALKKRVMVFAAPKRSTGNFPFSFFKVVDGRATVSDAIVDSFKQMGYKQGKPLNKGRYPFTKGKYRFTAGASAATSTSDNGHMQALIVSFEEIQ